jgi:hypothetical protein
MRRYLEGMYYIPPEGPSKSGSKLSPPRSGAATDECDFCGRTVHRESASQRVHRGDDGIEVVLVCNECDSADG